MGATKPGQKGQVKAPGQALGASCRTQAGRATLEEALVLPWEVSLACTRDISQGPASELSLHHIVMASISREIPQLCSCFMLPAPT